MTHLINTMNGLHRPSTLAYRSDTLAALSVASKRYNVVQPREVLHFYQYLVKAGEF